MKTDKYVHNARQHFKEVSKWIFFFLSEMMLSLTWWGLRLFFLSRKPDIFI